TCSTNKTYDSKQSTTSSYISDDCKVLYIETVIEVPKPVFYEQATNTISTTNTEYHHHIPHNQQTIASNRNKYFMDITNKNQHSGDSTDDDLSTQPVNLSTTINRHQLTEDHLKQQGDSGIELDQTSSSSTIYNQQISKDRLLFPSTNRNYDKTSPSTLVRRIQKQTATKIENLHSDKTLLISPVLNSTQTNTYWNRLKEKWFRSLIIGLLILLSLFLIYLCGL
ncbi:unnamed protein product, partial [Rotaria magnacalcarata]